MSRAIRTAVTVLVLVGLFGPPVSAQEAASPATLWSFLGIPQGVRKVRGALTNEAARSRGIFRQDYLETLFANPKEHITRLRGSELWQVAMLELWLQAQGIGE